MKINFIGESIHGVSEFTKFKLDWIERNSSKKLIVIFEADKTGIANSFLKGETAEQILLNFPRIHQTEEMSLLLKYLIKKNIPYIGADVVTRNKQNDVSSILWPDRNEQIAAENKIYSQPSPFALRDEYMCDVVAMAANEYPEHKIIGLFHNLHIKKHGSREENNLNLPSVAELLNSKHGLESYSVGVFAKSGTALHNNLSKFDFNINDVDVIEHLAIEGFVGIKEKNIMGDRTAYHHAFEKETQQVRLQYDECVVFSRVSPPNLLGKIKSGTSIR